MKSIKVSGGKYLALVSDQDYRKLSLYKWRAVKGKSTVYAVTKIKNGNRHSAIPMQRMILGTKQGFVIDHKDGLGLNNTRSNLRFCTPAQNSRNRITVGKNNTSGFKGVCNKKGNYKKPWVAQIKCDQNNYYLGRFSTPEEAAMAYNKKATELFGEFARLNILPRYPAKRHLI